MHRLFYTDVVVYEDDYRASKARLMPVPFANRDDALAMARDINARGGIAWEIETDGGATIGRWQIVWLLEDRAAGRVGRPKVR
jgi:hypothetical protein